MLIPITTADLPDVGRFLHEHLNSRLSPAQWCSALQPTWAVDAPNHGFQLRVGSDVVGAYLAIYSEREIRGRREKFCNLAAWCVVEDYRAHAVRLLRAVLAQRGYSFTDLSPSGNVVPINERLRFRHLDTTTVLVPTVPRGGRREHVRVVTDHDAIEERLVGDDLRIFRDHRDSAAARSFLLLRADGEQCLVLVRKDRRKRLPLFASVLFVSDRAVFHRCQGAVRRHLLWRHGALAMLAETRIVGAGLRGRVLGSPRPKMFRTSHLTEDDIDYLYSELTCVAW